MPVFYHVPKNSGTYVFNCLLSALKKESKGVVNVVRVLSRNKYTLAKFIVINNSDFLNQKNYFTPLNNAEITWSLNVENLTEDILKKLNILSFIIEARGFRCIKTLLKPVFLFLDKFNLYKFIILREPFSREQSLYHYITSDTSKHEISHGKFKSASFEEFVMSNQLQDSWLLRNLLDVPNGIKLTEKNFNEAIQYLQHVNVYDSRNTDAAIKKVLLKCFNIQNFDIESVSKKNENSYKKIKFKELSPEAQNSFNRGKYWDQKLYDYFVRRRHNNLIGLFQNV